MNLAGICRLTTIRESSKAENGEAQPQNKRGCLATLSESSEDENGEPQPQNKKRHRIPETFLWL